MADPTGFARRWLAALLCLGSSTHACAPERSPHDMGPSSTAGGGSRSGAATGGSSESGGVAGTGASGGMQGGASGAPPVATGGSDGNGGNGAPASGGDQGAAGSSGSATGGDGGASGSPGTDSSCVEAVADLPVYAAWDSLGYAPYALSGCQLAYVTPEGGLLLRDLRSGAETLLEDKGRSPRRPSVAAGLVAWEAMIDGKSSVRLFREGQASTISGNFDHAGEPRAAADAVVFTAWAEPAASSDTDVLLYDPAKGEVVATGLSGPGQQRFADVSREYVAASDFSEDPRGVFDEAGSIADLVVLDRSAGTITRRSRPGKQAFAMLGNDGVLAYLEWSAVHPEPKFSEFALRLGRVFSDPEQDVLVRAIHTEPSYVRPSLSGDVIDFIDTTGGSALLYRVGVGTPGDLVATQLDVTTPLGPIAAPGLTLLGVRFGGAVTLRVITRNGASP